MSIIFQKPLPAICTITGCKSSIIAHIIYLIPINRYFFQMSFNIFPMHIQKTRIVMAKYFQLIAPAVSPASITYIHLTNIMKHMPCILRMTGSNRIIIQQNMMSIQGMQLYCLTISSGTFYMITGIMLHEPYPVFMQFLANICIISM